MLEKALNETDNDRIFAIFVSYFGPDTIDDVINIGSRETEITRFQDYNNDKNLQRAYKATKNKQLTEEQIIDAHDYIWAWILRYKGYLG